MFQRYKNLWNYQILLLFYAIFYDFFDENLSLFLAKKNIVLGYIFILIFD